MRDFPRVPEALSLDTPAVVFHAAALGAVNPAFLSVRFDGGVPAGFSGASRRIGAEVDPALQVRRAVPLVGVLRSGVFAVALRHRGHRVATLSVLLLSAAGMYALMSFTVAQRTREIGIRVALGARPRRLFFSIFGRVLRQLAIGIGAGSLVSGLLMSAVDLNPRSRPGS